LKNQMLPSNDLDRDKACKTPGKRSSLSFSRMYE
jgi:hypothetical protein